MIPELTEGRGRRLGRCFGFAILKCQVPHFSDLGSRKIQRMTASDFHLFQATPLQGRSPTSAAPTKDPEGVSCGRKDQHRRPAGHTCGILQRQIFTRWHIAAIWEARDGPTPSHGHAALGLPFPTLETAKRRPR